MIKFNCPKCSATINASDNQAGAKGRCKKCKSVVEVPKPASENFDDTEEWGGSSREDDYDDGPQDSDDSYRQLRPKKTKTIATERLWLKLFQRVATVSAFIAGIGLTLVGIFIGATYAWRKLPKAEMDVVVEKELVVLAPQQVPPEALVKPEVQEPPVPLVVEIRDNPEDLEKMENAFLVFEAGRGVDPLWSKDYTVLLEKFKGELAVAKKGIRSQEGLDKFATYNLYASTCSLLLAHNNFEQKTGLSETKGLRSRSEILEQAERVLAKIASF